MALSLVTVIDGPPLAVILPDPSRLVALTITCPPRAVSFSSWMATTVSLVTPDLKMSFTIGSVKP